jgi:hypothetical protein
MRVSSQVTCISCETGAYQFVLGALDVSKNGADVRWVCSSVGQSAPLIRVRSEVRIFPDPPHTNYQGGAIAQLGERVLCKHEVVGSIPTGSTIPRSSSKILCVSDVGLMCGYVGEVSLRLLFKNSEVVLTPRFKRNVCFE